MEKLVEAAPGAVAVALFLGVISAIIGTCYLTGNIQVVTYDVKVVSVRTLGPGR